MKFAPGHRSRGHLKKVKAPRGAYTYLRAPCIIGGPAQAKQPAVNQNDLPPLFVRAADGTLVRPTIKPTIDRYSLMIRRRSG